MLKKYYGEKFAFYYAFFLNYLAFLLYPTVLGLCIFGYQIYDYNATPLSAKTQTVTGKDGKKVKKPIDLQKIIDNPYNALYGAIIGIWASILIERWRSL